MSPPMTEEKRAAVLADLHAGKSRNATSRDNAVGAASVSKIAAENGIVFDRAATTAATTAAVADHAALRAEASGQYVAISRKINARVLTMLDDPDVKPWHVRDMMISSGVAYDKHLAQAVHDAGIDNNGADVDRWLFAMTGQVPPAGGELSKTKVVLGSLVDDLVSKHGTGPDAPE